VVAIDRLFSEKIKKGEYNINEIYKEKNIKTLSESVFEVFEKGETSLEEIYPILISSI